MLKPLEENGVEANAPSNKSMDVRAKQLLSYYVILFPLLACIRFCATSSQPLYALW